MSACLHSMYIFEGGRTAGVQHTNLKLSSSFIEPTTPDDFNTSNIKAAFSWSLHRHVLWSEGFGAVIWKGLKAQKDE